MLSPTFPGGTVVKNLPANAGDARDTGSIPRSGRSPGGGNGNPLQYACLKSSTDRGPDYCPWSFKELDMAKHTRTCTHTHTHTHTLTQLIHVVVQQTLTQHCKAIILKKQNLIKKRKHFSSLPTLESWWRGLPDSDSKCSFPNLITERLFSSSRTSENIAFPWRLLPNVFSACIPLISDLILD